MCLGYNHSSRGIERQGHGLAKVETWSVWLRSSIQESLFSSINDRTILTLQLVRYRMSSSIVCLSVFLFLFVNLCQTYRYSL